MVPPCGVGPVTASTSPRPSIPDILERQAGVAAPPGFEDAIAWLAPPGEGEEPHWHVTFAVADRDDAVATGRAARRAAGRRAREDNEWTKSAVVRDPQGAVFTLSQFDPTP